MPPSLPPVATIGYENATPPTLLAALADAGVRTVVDVRALANSRRPGFAKTRLSASLAEAGIAYLHLRSLGTPAEGRAAARAGHHAEMQAVFAAHLETAEAREGMEVLERVAREAGPLCLLCLEADPAHCHRTLVADALAERLGTGVTHLHPETP